MKIKWGERYYICLGWKTLFSRKFGVFTCYMAQAHIRPYLMFSQPCSPNISGIGFISSVRVVWSCLWSLILESQYSYIWASISYLVNHGPQTLTASVLLFLFDSLGHVRDPRYLKQFIFVFSGSVRLGQNGNFGYFGILAKIVGSGYPKANN